MAVLEYGMYIIQLMINIISNLKYVSDKRDVWVMAAVPGIYIYD